MKKILSILAIILFVSCESSFPDLSPKEVDDEGDPIVVDPDPENENLGLVNSYCYGYNNYPSIDLIATIETNITYPSSHDISSYLPEVRSQGSQGSCVGWATGYYLKTFQENFENNQFGSSSNDENMSPAYVYNQIKPAGCNDGSGIQDAFELLKDYGIVNWNEFPYDQSSCDTQPTDDQNLLAVENKIESFYYLDPDDVFNQTKAFLLNDQPVVIGITIDRSYFGAIDDNGDSVYRKYRASDGGHAMLVVGYNDSKNAFKVVNSWGSAWGNSGFVWIDYQAFEEVNDLNSDFKILCEAWVSDDIIN